MKNDSLVFRLNLPKAEVQDVLIRYMQGQNMINGHEEQYFTEMNSRGKNFQFEFVVPLSEIKQKDE